MIDLRAQRYNAVAMTLHWLIAALLIANILIAWYFNTLTACPRSRRCNCTSRSASRC